MKKFSISFFIFMTGVLAIGAERTAQIIESGSSINGRAAVSPGSYVFSGKGTLLLDFDAAGDFSGTAALPGYGVVNMSGTLAGGTYVLNDRISGAQVFSGTVVVTASSKGPKLVLDHSPQKTFTGSARSSKPITPAGLFQSPFPPVAVLYQFVPSGDPLIVTVQGDQDFSLDLNLALGGQIVFDNQGRGYGVAYENSSPTGATRLIKARYRSNGKMSLSVYAKIDGGKKRSIRLSMVESGGKYDGVYNARITPAGCVPQVVKVTIKNDVLSGADTTTGTISGFVDTTGHLIFSSQKLIVSDTTCVGAGAHAGPITFTADPSSAAFPQIMAGTFAGSDIQGTFTLEQPDGVTGATSASTTPRAEIWTGTLTGLHESNICPGGKWDENYDISLTFPSDLIAALRGTTKILAGTGGMSGTETVKSQPPATLSCTYLNSTLANTAVNIVFAGKLNPNGPVIDLQSPTVLIPSTIHSTLGEGSDQSENRSTIRLKINHMSATRLTGEWQYGNFELTKK